MSVIRSAALADLCALLMPALLLNKSQPDGKLGPRNRDLKLTTHPFPAANTRSVLNPEIQEP